METIINTDNFSDNLKRALLLAQAPPTNLEVISNNTKFITVDAVSEDLPNTLIIKDDTSKNSIYRVIGIIFLGVITFVIYKVFFESPNNKISPEISSKEPPVALTENTENNQPEASGTDDSLQKFFVPPGNNK